MTAEHWEAVRNSEWYFWAFTAVGTVLLIAVTAIALTILSVAWAFTKFVASLIYFVACELTGHTPVFPQWWD